MDGNDIEKILEAVPTWHQVYFCGCDGFCKKFINDNWETWLIIKEYLDGRK